MIELTENDANGRIFKSRAEQSRAEQSRAEQSRAEQSRAEQSRFEGLDLLKFICAFLIVYIHCPFLGVIGECFTAIARIAVPIFFMITGFFYSDVVAKKKEILQIKKIARMTGFANVLYAIWKTMLAVMTGKGVLEYWKSILTVKNAIKFFIFNESPFNAHLWYLSAILYVLLIVYFLDRFRFSRILYIITPLLLLGDLIMGKYSLLIFGREFSYILVRNFLFVGLPYFTVGRVIRVFFKDLNRILSVSWAYPMCIFLIATLLERFILKGIGMNATRDHYISTTFLAISAFLSSFTYFSNRQLTGLEKAATMIGQNYSAGIYIIHPILITCLETIIEGLGLYTVYAIFAPFAVFALSIICMMFLNYGVKQIKHRWKIASY